MRLQIDKNWAVDWDGQCYTLVRFSVITGEGKGALKTKAENIGKIRETSCGYHGRLSSALLSYIDKAMLEGEGTTDINALMTRLSELESSINAIIDPHQKPLAKAAAPKQPKPEAKPEVKLVAPSLPAPAASVPVALVAPPINLGSVLEDL